MSHIPSRIDSAAMAVALVGVIMAVCKSEFSWIVILVGAGLSALVRLYVRARTTDRNQMRLMAVHLFASVALMLTAYLLYAEKRYWIIPTAVAAAVELYVSFRIRKD